MDVPINMVIENGFYVPVYILIDLTTPRPLSPSLTTTRVQPLLLDKFLAGRHFVGKNVNKHCSPSVMQRSRYINCFQKTIILNNTACA